MATASEIEVTKAYIGLLGRAPDPAGLAYWVTELDALVAAGQDSVVALKKLTNDITLSTEWDNGIGANDGTTTAGSEAIVTAMYSNLFERATSQAELDYWAPKIVSGEFTASEMAVALIQGAGEIDGAVMLYKQLAATYYVEVAGSNYTATSATASVSSVDGPITYGTSKTATDYVASGVGETLALTTATNDAPSLTAGSDTITGISGTGVTVQSTDTITDSSAVDSDVISITGDDDFAMPTISGVETINVSIGKQVGAGFSSDFANLTGGTVNYTVASTVDIVGISVTGEQALTVTNLSSDLSTTNVVTLDADLDGEAATVTTDSAITTLTVSTINDNDTTIVMGNESGGSLNISGTANTNDAASITGTGTIVLDASEAGGNQDVEVLTLSGGSNDVTFDISGVTTGGNMSYTTAGSYGVTLQGIAADFSTASFTMGAATGLDIDTGGGSIALDMTSQGVFTGGIDISADVGNTNTATVTVQSGNTVQISADQNAGANLTLVSANDTTADSITLTLSNDVGNVTTTNFETVTVNTGAADVVIDSMTSSDNDAALTISGTEDITVTTTVTAGTTAISGNEVTVTQTTDSTVAGINVDAVGAMTLTGNVTGTNEVDLDAGGAIVIGAGVDNTRGDITINGDSVSVTGATTATLGTVAIVATNDVDVDALTSTAGSFTSSGAAFAGGGAIAAQNDITISHSGPVTLASTTTTTGAGGSNAIVISGNDIDATGLVGHATTARSVTLTATNDAATSDIDGGISSSYSITLADGKFDATGQALTTEGLLIIGDTDLLGGNVVAESVTITTTNDVTLDAVEEKVAGEGVVVSGASATGNIAVTVAGSSTGTATVYTGSGNDTVILNENTVINVQSNAGADIITVTDLANDSVISTGDGADVVTATVAGAEEMAFTLNTGAGNDTINAGNLSATIDGGDGTDTVNFDAAMTNTLFTMTNIEVLDLAGDATLTAANFANESTFQVTGVGQTLTINGSAGTTDQTISAAGLSFDIGDLADIEIDGGSGNDTLTGSDAVDVIDGGAAADTITGGGGGDTLNGDAGEDTISGGGGADTLNGGGDNDTITGGAGADTITGGGGTDTLTGGADVDRFVLVTASADTITDFVSGTDKLDITGHVASTAETVVPKQAAATDALANAEYFIFNTDGTAANLTNSGTATITDITNEVQVAAYIGEQFTAKSGGGLGAKAVFIINFSDTNSYIFLHTEDNTAGITNSEIELVGILTSSTATAGDFI